MKTKVKLGRKKGSTNVVNTLKGLVPLMYSLGVASIGVGIATGELTKMFAEEVRRRLLEFKLMGIIEIEVRDKHKKTKIEYHQLKEIKKYLEKLIWIRNYGFIKIDLRKNEM